MSSTSSMSPMSPPSPSECPMAGTLEVQATWGCRKRRRRTTTVDDNDGRRRQRGTATTTTVEDDKDERRRPTTTTLSTTNEAHGNDDFRRPRRQHRTAVAAGLLRRGAPLSEANKGPARGRSAQATDRRAISATASTHERPRAAKRARGSRPFTRFHVVVVRSGCSRLFVSFGILFIYPSTGNSTRRQAHASTTAMDVFTSCTAR